MMDSAPKPLFLPKEKENRLFTAKKEQVENPCKKEPTMKVQKALSGILLGLGCAIAFIGLLALVLPAIPNQQLHLVLASFDMSSSHPLVAAMNKGMSFALHNGWQVLFTGLFLLMVGVSLFVFLSVRESRREGASPFPDRSDDDFPSRPLWEPHPEPRHNPFADMAKWDSFAPLNPGTQEPSFAFARHRSPLLEPNRVEEVPMPDANPFARPMPEPVKAPAPDVSWEPETAPEPEAAPSPEPAWEPALKPLTKPEPPQAPDIPSEHMTFGRSLVRSTFPQPEPPAAPEGEPVYTPNEEEPAPPSPRIRSTMGRHREW